MDFIANSETQVQEMLATIGIDDVSELFQDIPEALRCSAPAEDDGISEYEGLRLMEGLAAKNSFPQRDNYLGAGCYEHHVPAIVSAICSKSNFLTAYTPYQGEASQGMLQAIYEFQTAVCALTGLDMANASLYDGASACAEAALMALRHQRKRNKILVAGTLHPHYRALIDQYLSSHEVIIETVPATEGGGLDSDKLTEMLDSDTACVIFQYPNFFGTLEDIKALTPAIQEAGALTVISANPMVYGLFASAGELGADIAVGDTQPFGVPMQFGGPHVGYMACRKALMRQMPGRLVGETLDTEGKRSFVLTLQAREQHIRREKATSNICSNQALAALASLVGMLWYGKEGAKELALTNYQRASYLKEGLSGLPGVRVLNSGTIFNEFTVEFQKPITELQAAFREAGIEPGLALESYFPERKGQLLVAVTEVKSKEQLDRYLEIAREVTA